MDTIISASQLIALGMTQEAAEKLADEISARSANASSEDVWESIIRTQLLRDFPFPIHFLIFNSLFPSWREYPETAPAWIPSIAQMAEANISLFMASELKTQNLKAFHTWSVSHYEDFWQKIISKLGIIFKKPPQKICDLNHGMESPSWLPGAKLNISDSCLSAVDSETALIYLDDKKNISKLSYGELTTLSNRIANSLVKQGYQAGDAIAIIMPMNMYAVALYLGIIKMGGVVVSIADSFSTTEIATRLKIAKTKGIFTQDFITWGGKNIPLYEKICAADTIKTIVLSHHEKNHLTLRKNDLSWNDFLSKDNHFESVASLPMAACNILFSSGTTADPKAIPWDHTTAIKAASDAFFHQNIQARDVLAWPTNLGWMMGPWLIFAALINRATIALYPDSPKDQAFGDFVQKAKVTMLGVVPTLVATWRQTKCMEACDWSSIKVFSSTGECSNPEDMFYLMSLANYKPVIEYCGGTEIGGAYLSSTVIEKNYPSLFSTPTIGLDIAILNEQGKPADIGEVAIIPPSMGLSTTLLNANHHHIYYANMPTLSNMIMLRRHGDQIKRYPNGYYSILGRVDDTMNLGAIKVSAAEIERVITGIADVREVAAIAVSKAQGPNQLVIFAATTSTLDKQTVMKEMQHKINTYLNPLFKIQDVIFVNDLPKTASNKIMRRILRTSYLEA